MADNLTDEKNEIISGEGCTLINVEEVQSIDLNSSFSKESLPGGWRITVKKDCEVTVNYRSSMRKTDIPMGSGDQIERDGDTVFLIRKQPIESSRGTMSASPLAVSLDKIRSSSSPLANVERRSPIPSPPQQKK